MNEEGTNVDSTLLYCFQPSKEFMSLRTDSCHSSGQNSTQNPFCLAQTCVFEPGCFDIVQTEGIGTMQACCPVSTPLFTLPGNWNHSVTASEKSGLGQVLTLNSSYSVSFAFSRHHGRDGVRVYVLAQLRLDGEALWRVLLEDHGGNCTMRLELVTHTKFVFVVPHFQGSSFQCDNNRHGVTIMATTGIFTMFVDGRRISHVDLSKDFYFAALASLLSTGVPTVE